MIRINKISLMIQLLSMIINLKYYFFKMSNKIKREKYKIETNVSEFKFNDRIIVNYCTIYFKISVTSRFYF